MTVRGMVPDWMSIQLANALVLIGLGLVWVGARQFEGRRPRPAMIAIAPLIWFVACAIPAIGSDINARTVIASALAASLAFVSGCEIWRGRAEPLLSRWPTVVTLFIYAALMFARVPVTLLVPQPKGAYLLTASLLYPLLAFSTLLFVVVLAFLLLNMTKERSELRHKTAALVDPLTGVANRRAFLAGGEQLSLQGHSDGSALAVLLFDLDHFKAINDRFGHAAGDAVLTTFAQTAARTLGPKALFGRIGGEEFGAVLRVMHLGEALAHAEQVRRAFAAAAPADDVVPTVSIGVALENETDRTLATLMAAADHALYRAKAKGRNRVASAVFATMEDMPPAEEGERRAWRKLPASA
ncbi:MAG TPA: GGDEF domain-containing protein [Pseudolabrys sp.]|nr:GGDEF domain-containing protein [Pseudolabrys sp.]